MKLGEILLQEQKVSLRQLNEALQTQARLGGRLGTSLLELGFVDEPALLAAIGRQRSTRTVSQTELSNVPANVVHMIPAKVALRYRIVPYRLQGRTLFVASRNVGDAFKEDEIGFLTSCMVRTCIGLELRIVEALTHYYQVKGPERYRNLVEKLAAGPISGNGSRAVSVPESSTSTTAGPVSSHTPSRQDSSPSFLAPSVPAPATAAQLAAPQPAAPQPAAPQPAAPQPAVPQAAASQPAAAPSAASPSAAPQPAPPRPPPKPKLFVELDEEDAALLGTSSSDNLEPWRPSEDEPVLLEPTPLPWLARRGAAEGPESAMTPSSEAPASQPDAPPTAEMPATADEGQPPTMAEGTATRHGYADLSPEDGLLKAAVELKSVEMRDDIADVLLAYCEPLFRRRLLLVVRQGKIMGWRGEGEGVSTERIRGIEIQVSEPSVFLGLRGADSFWLGALPRLKPNQTLVEGLGGDFPKDCLVLPVVLRSRVVCFLYGDNLEAGVAGAPLADLRRLAAKAGLAFEVYILKNKLRIL